ncbi:MAG TPA: acetate--CoA ligase [Polyangiaceae bacterium]|jgi:acetyl-CoA synthetase|nr:acetate--CoA ligase [Polyangiaceae bacterium]
MSDASSISSHLKETRRFEPPKEFAAGARIGSRADYDRLYRESIDSPETFWKRETATLVWRKPWTTLLDWKPPHARWFDGATLNVTESCLDQHLATSTRTKTAILWESELDEGAPGTVRKITYEELYRDVVRCAGALAKLGVQKGDRVAIYMGMVPEVAIAMLACARLGAPHTVVFGGFAADALRDRINDCQCKVLITQDAGTRRGALVPLKATADKAAAQCPSIERVLVYRRLGQEKAPIEMKAGRDIDWTEALAAAGNEGEKAVELEAEHPLFILYTSGSTGKPKGVLHTTAGYLVGAHVSTKYIFDLRPDDLYWCTADVGWVTGHSYLVYGPLSNGATCFMYEGAPNFPDNGRLWRMIERHRITILYTAPTAIRAFIRWGNEWPNKSDLSSLRLLGTVGEPINPEAWMWYRQVIGKERCPIVDTWWQTETGSILLTTLPGASATKPGSTGLPFFGVVPDIVDKDGQSVGPTEGGGFLVVKRPWPSMLRTVWGDDDRFRQQYWTEIPGAYFTGDGGRRDADGYYWVVGRIDDVLNVAGHRIGTAEIESALVAHAAVAEAAAVGRPDDLKGQALVAFVTLKPGFSADSAMKAKLMTQVETEIGKFARPDAIRFADALPKTRSGKIMRRLLKDVAAGTDAKGDTSTLEDLSVLAKLRADEE